MEYRSLGTTGAKVAPLCLGTMMFGGPTDETDSIALMHRALDAGINFFDTANVYNEGQSEVVVGKAIGDRRDRVVLATKGRQRTGAGPNDAGSSRLHLMRELDRSLKRLNTDYVDVYYAHAPDETTPLDELLRAFDDMVRSGRVHYVACSNFRAWQVCEGLWTSDRLNLHRFACVQPLYNIVNRDIEVELLPFCRNHGLGVVSYSPLARGILTGKYRAGTAFPEGSRAARNDKRILQAEMRDASLEIAQDLVAHCVQKGATPSNFALAWVLANSIVTSVIIGPRTREQLEDNLECLDLVITAEDEAFVDRLVPPGEHSGKGFQDSAYPIVGRPTRSASTH